MNTAIVVAAGSGSRFDSTVPKQFAEIIGKPVVVHTLEAFEACEAIDQVILVLPADNVDRFESMGPKFGLSKLTRIVAGGESRTGSVICGFNAADPTSHVVAVHDGARPLVTPAEIAATVDAASRFGAACLAAPITDTIKRVENDRIVETLDRSELRRALTPQAFRYDILKNALAAADGSVSATDECVLAERCGQEIVLVEGSGQNIKITFPEDLLYAEAVLRSRI